MIEYGVSSTSINNLFGSTYAGTQANLDALAGNILGQGIDHFQKKDYSRAINSFKRTAALSPFSDNAAKAYDYIGKAYLQMEKTDQAIKTYSEAIRIYPNRSEFHRALGDIYLKEKKSPEALRAYEAAVRLKPDDAEIRYSLGQSYLNAGEIAKAGEQFSHTVRLTPTSAAGFYGLGQAARAAGNLTDAVGHLTRAIRVNRNFELAYIELGRTYADQEDFSKAEDMLAILTDRGSAKTTELENYINQASKPKIIAALSPNGFNTGFPAKTAVSSLDPEKLSAPDSRKMFSMQFAFSKDMNASSVVNANNWKISRATIRENGGVYNRGLAPPATEAFLLPRPAYVVFDAGQNKATVNFFVSQNSSGNATIDPRHIVFKFSGVDAYGKAMDLSADEYSGFSSIA